MTRTRWLTPFWLMTLACGSGVVGVVEQGGAAPATRLDGRVVPTFESIVLELDAERPDYTGSVRIELEVRAATDQFRFHAEEMSLDRVELRGPEGTFDVSLESGEEGLVMATTAQRLKPGGYTLEIDFSNEFDTRAVGLYRMEHGGQGYVFTQMEADDARKGFPCWDEPNFKIPYQLTLRIPRSHRAVTNTPLESEEEAEGLRTLVFARTPPLPSYLLAVATGPLESVPIPGLSVPGRVYTVAGQSRLAGAAAEVTPAILTALERYFDRPYPYAKLDLIAVPEFWPGAMENPGAVTFADGLLLVDPRAAGVSQRRRLVSVTAHELAHMWFGNLVTMSWWDDLWLNESFASWLGDKVTHELYPQYGADIAGLRRVQRLMAADARPSTKPIRKPVRSSVDIMEGLGLAYGKGQAVLGMIEQWIGPDVFRQGVADYIEGHAWANAEAADLWNALSKVSKKDVGRSMASFLDQPGYPMIAVEVEPDGVLTIRQSRFLNHGVEAPAHRWTLPIGLKYSDGKEVGTRTVLLTEPAERVDLEREIEWVMPHAGAYGYYRWQVPPAMLEHLARNARQTMDARERVAFLGNTGALLDAGVLGGDGYLETLGAFAEDPEPEVVSSVIAGLDKVQLSLVPDDLGDAFALYVRRTLRPALKRFGLEPSEGEAEAVTLFRPRLFAWLGEEGRDAEVRRYAESLARAYMADPASIDPSLASVALQVAAIEGGRELFEAYKRRFEQAQVPAERSRFLGAVGAFADSDLQDEALQYALGGPVRPTELFSIPRGLPETEAARDRAYRWLTDNFEKISESVPPDFRTMLPFFASGCSEKRLEAAQAFFESPEHEVPGADRTLARVRDQVTDCVNLRRREGATVAAYLERLEDGG